MGPTSDNDASNVTVSGYVPLYNHDTAQYVAVSTAPVCVDYAVAADEALAQVVTSGTAYTSSDIDYTVKVFDINSAPAPGDGWKRGGGKDKKKNTYTTS